MADTLTLTRFAGPKPFVESDLGSGLRGLYVDTETTGLDTKNDKIVELTILPFRFLPDGVVLGAEYATSWLEDPGIPIPAEATKVHGITNEMVKHTKIDDNHVGNEVQNSILVISHNAEFDRPILERRFPVFRDARWGCSMRDVPWKDFGCSSSVLEFLLFKHCHEFVEESQKHRTATDCGMGLHVLETEFPTTADTPLGFILEAVRTWWVRCFARNAHYDTRHDLKARGYRWDADGKVWYRDIARSELEVEADWLRGFCEPVFRNFTGKERYSERI